VRPLAPGHQDPGVLRPGGTPVQEDARQGVRSPHRLAAELDSGRWRGDPEKARELSVYLTNNGDYLNTYRSMGPGLWMHGSAPAEKHVELTVNRRFKRRGMRWSKRGARNLLTIRLEVIASR
jgi:hypothetical protein